jgi:hypothetical protein
VGLLVEVGVALPRIGDLVPPRDAGIPAGFLPRFGAIAVLASVSLVALATMTGVLLSFRPTGPPGTG